MRGATLALVVLVVLVLIGSPLALSIRGTQPEWTGLAFESAVIGLAVEMLVAIVLLHAGYYSLPTALGLTVLVVGGATVAARRAGARGAVPRLDLSLLKRSRPTLIGLGTLALMALALLLRRSPSYFIFQTGDMGGYVNAANLLTRGQHFGTSPQGFTLFLRETNLLLGTANTVAGLPALGAILVLGVIAIARALGLHVAVAIGMGFLVAVHPVMVWFSVFPVSESLYATLLVALLYFVVRARSSTSASYAVIAGIIAGGLLIVRGEAILLAPVIVVVLLASAIADDEPTAAVQRRFTVVALISLFVAYAYDVHYTHVYFRGQLRLLLRGTLSHFVERAHLEDLSVVLVIAGALALAAVLLGTAWISRWARPRIVARPLAFWSAVYGAVIGSTAAALLFFHTAGLDATLARWGIPLIALCVVGAAAIVIRPGKYIDPTSGLMCLLIVGVYTVLFARRVPQPKPQTYYLYFDRYLFSEVLPAALVLAVIGFQMLVNECRRFSPSRRVFRAAIAGMLVILVVTLVPQIHETRRVTRYRLLGKSYDAVHTLDELTSAHGAGVIVYSGSKTRPRGWFYPNTYRAFALPLEQSFGRRVFGIPTKSSAKDDLFNPSTALALLARKHLTSGYLVALRRPGRSRFPVDDQTQYVGTLTYLCPILGESTHGPAAPWVVSELQFDVYHIAPRA